MIELLSTKTLCHLELAVLPEAGTQKDRSRFDVNTVRTGRLCIARPSGDHARAVTVLVDSSSPIEKFSILPCGGSGHSRVVKVFARN